MKSATRIFLFTICLAVLVTSMLASCSSKTQPTSTEAGPASYGANPDIVCGPFG